MGEPVVFPSRVDVVGARISLISYEEIIHLTRHPRSDRATVMAVCNVHSVITARRDPELSTAIDEADVATPDGMPLVWAIRRLYAPQQRRVYGPTIMRRVLAEGGRDLSHFLYGSLPETLDSLRRRIVEFHPEASIVGCLAPPFRPLRADELDEHVDTIRRSGASVVWVGLGMPKQELWMARVAHRLPGVTLLGVGAAFDLLAGNVRQAPRWIQEAGLEWLFRLALEPRRLWRRYLSTNPMFVILLLRQLALSRHSTRGQTGR